MKKQNENTNLISTICENLENDSVELIDFDALKAIVIDLQKVREHHDEMARELGFIKKEYRSRIIGMLKAVIACRSDESDAEILTSLSGDIDDIDTGRLVKLYSRVAARFRKSFPASFRYLTYPTNPYGQKKWSEYKI